MLSRMAQVPVELKITQVLMLFKLIQVPVGFRIMLARFHFHLQMTSIPNVAMLASMHSSQRHYHYHHDVQFFYMQFFYTGHCWNTA